MPPRLICAEISTDAQKITATPRQKARVSCFVDFTLSMLSPFPDVQKIVAANRRKPGRRIHCSIQREDLAEKLSSVGNRPCTGSTVFEML